jgi:hypothetical protein
LIDEARKRGQENADGDSHWDTWRSRADADTVREKYKDSEAIRQLTPLLARPRDRWVTCMDGAPTPAEHPCKT